MISGSGRALERSAVLSNSLGAKLLHEVVPKTDTVAVLFNPTHPSTKAQLPDVQRAADTLGLKLHVHYARSESDIDRAFATLVQQGAGALLLGVDPFLTNRRDQIIALAAQHAIPTIDYREFSADGGPMSYAPSPVDGYRQCGRYTGRILKGEKPSDIPVLLPTKFEIVINLKTAKQLGLTIPQPLLVTADEVIE